LIHLVECVMVRKIFFKISLEPFRMSLEFEIHYHWEKIRMLFKTTASIKKPDNEAKSNKKGN